MFIKKTILIIGPYNTLIQNKLSEIPDDCEQVEKLMLKHINWIFIDYHHISPEKRPHKSWKGTKDDLCNKIKELQFDFAVVDCEGYSYPITHYIYKEIQKPAFMIHPLYLNWFGISKTRNSNTRKPVNLPKTDAPTLPPQ